MPHRCKDESCDIFVYATGSWNRKDEELGTLSSRNPLCKIR